MYKKEFTKNDILVNTIKTHPKYEFYITNKGQFLLKNRPDVSELLKQNEIGLNDILLNIT
jgi:hypothetical protein